jgi:hypothetical protein
MPVNGFRRKTKQTHPSRLIPLCSSQQVFALIHNLNGQCDGDPLMKSNLAQLDRERKKLVSALSEVRQTSMRATAYNDYRTVGRLTLEAARLNRALSDVDVAELSAL